jgi:hypothetical protein
LLFGGEDNRSITSIVSGRSVEVDAANRPGFAEVDIPAESGGFGVAVEGQGEIRPAVPVGEELVLVAVAAALTTEFAVIRLAIDFLAALLASLFAASVARAFRQEFHIERH